MQARREILQLLFSQDVVEITMVEVKQRLCSSLHESRTETERGMFAVLTSRALTLFSQVAENTTDTEITISVNIWLRGTWNVGESRIVWLALYVVY